MAVFKTALVLVHLVASSLAWENLPSIPANRRAEYFLQHDDGAYKFGYDTGEGQSALASADAANQVQGEFSYVDRTGQRVNWEYTAGDGGFVPVMRAGSSEGSSLGAFGAKTTGFSSRAHSAHSGVIPVSSAYTGASSDGVDADYDENADASYNFNVDTASYKRTESADSKGNIQGQYSYNSPVGGSRAVSYIAGEGTGFVVTSDESSGAQQGYTSGSHKSATSSGYNYQAPQQTYLPPATSYAGASSDGQTQVNPDGSFSFSYTTGDNNHQAVADAQNNVRGSYSYKSHDDGQTRKVDYQAGSATGFVASGAHLPVAPAVPSAVSSYSAGGRKSYSASGNTGFGSFGGANHRSGSEPSNAQTVVNPDGSFSYSYSTGDQSRHETGDAQNNVRGSFSFKSKDDGQTRKVDYVAGASTGFVATGDHLPVAPSHDSGAASHSTKTSAFGHRASSQSSNVGAVSSYAAPSSNNAQSDGSYSFSYQTDDHSHHAASDPQGNVAGSFSFVAKDGVSRKIDYTAGGDKGFVAKGAHLPVAPEASATSGISAHSSGGGHYQTSAGSTGGGYQYAAPSASSYSGDSDDNNDGSYSYSYDTGSSSKHESADSKGNVAGSFSYLGGDGVNRQLTYTSRADEGFIAMGEHLPAAPASMSGQEVGLTVQNAFAHPDLFASSVDTNAASRSHGSSSGNVMAAKDGEYSYSYSTGGGSAGALSYKSSASGQNSFGSGARKLYSSPAAATGSHGSSSGQVMASKDGAYSYSYTTGGGAAPAASTYKSSASGQNSFGTGAISTYSAPSVASSSHSSSAGQVMASKDGAYSYSYTTGGKSAAAPAASSYKSGQNNFGSSAAKSYSSSNSANAAVLSSGSQQNDGSYSFSYDAGTHSHQQTSDPQNNVRGSFSFKAKDDGQVRKVDYIAGPSTGFVAQGAHLPVVPEASSSGHGATAYTGGRSSYSPGIKAPAHGGHISASSKASSGYDASDESGDASYSYSYNTDTSSKQETSDAKGNVVGTFSYLGGDGVNRKLSYTAKNEAGFNAAGDHLPVAPTIAGSSQFGAKTSVADSHRFGQQTGATAYSASTSHLNAHAHGQEIRDGNVVISKYLPPDSTHKFGYIFDTKA